MTHACPSCTPLGFPVHPATFYDLACDEHRAQAGEFWSPAAREARRIADVEERRRKAGLRADVRRAEQQQMDELVMAALAGGGQKPKPAAGELEPAYLEAFLGTL